MNDNSFWIHVSLCVLFNFFSSTKSKAWRMWRVSAVLCRPLSKLFILSTKMFLMAYFSVCWTERCDTLFIIWRCNPNETQKIANQPLSAVWILSELSIDFDWFRGLQSYITVISFWNINRWMCMFFYRYGIFYQPFFTIRKCQKFHDKPPHLKGMRHTG